MKKSALLPSCLLLLPTLAPAIDFNGLTSIGSIASHATSPDAVTATCDDHSQVRFQVLSPDLVRVRASFGKPLPDRDHSWAVALRDLAFAGGAWAFAGSQTRQSPIRGSNWLILIGRFCIAIPVVFFGVEHFLHPEFAPVVPLSKLTPAWIPFRLFWGDLTGAVLLVSGTGMLFMRKPRICATWLGAWITLIVLFIYLPIFAAGDQPRELSEGMNYFGDTLLFGGMVLQLAAALPKDNPAQPAQPLAMHAS
jgi:hypothetical protein